MSFSDLPKLNALLNSITVVFLLSGYAAIRAGRKNVHRAFMIAALLTSAVFLTSYLVYHSQAGVTRFPGQGWFRTVYFSILISHTILAATVPPLALTTVWLAARGRFDRHRRLARWTLPVWLYVSGTGVVIYVMLSRAYA